MKGFAPGEVWLDTDGNPIQAHSAGILHDNGTYYWYGEHKGGKTDKPPAGLARVDVIGISCYSSKDLYNWKYEGLALPANTSSPAHDLHPGKVLERPKVVFNDRTKQYVMWMHVDTADYGLRTAGVAVSDSPAGPFQFLGSMHPNGLVSGDQTIFKDDDGAAYHVCASNWNSCTVISRLADDYLRPSGEYVTILDSGKKNGGREAPAICKRGGRYHLVTSGCTGWAPNAASHAIADNMLGEWRTIGNPCEGEGADKTFTAQGTFILPVTGSDGGFIFLADRWNPDNLGDSRYVWLPIAWEEDRMRIKWLDHWDLSLLGRPKDNE